MAGRPRTWAQPGLWPHPRARDRPPPRRGAWGLMRPRPYHLYTFSRPPLGAWRVSARATQPGLASWWRLIAPGLDWASAHSRRVAYACLSGVMAEAGSSPKAFHRRPFVSGVPHRERLVTVTRGPMACKKQSRVQLLVRRQVVALETTGLVRPTALCGPRGLGALLGLTRAFALVWAQPLSAPFVVVGARVSWPASAGPLLAWR